MKLAKFEIRNFKGIQNASFEWDNIVVLIGENNAGKSTVLQALKWFLSGSQIKDEALFHDNETDEEHKIELIGYFDQLTEDEKQAQAVRGRMNEEQWIIKKRFWFESGDTEEHERSGWKEQYYSFSSEEKFSNWPEPDSSWGSFPQEYQDLIEQIPNRGARPNNQTRDTLRQLVRQHKPELIGHTEPLWIPNPGGGGNWKSNANSIVPRFIFVKAVHDATDEAISKEASSFGKIVNLIVERKMMQRPEVVELRNQIEAVLELFRPDPEHPERQAEEIRDLQNRINERLNEVIGGIASIKTSEPDIRPMLLPSTTLAMKDREDSVETSVEHQGHGLQRILIMTLLQILAEIQAEPEPIEIGEEIKMINVRPVVLAVEEPELYMHPQMERKMRDALYRLAFQPDVQVICSTHSPVFLDMSQRHKSIVRVVKDNNREVSFFQVIQDFFEGGETQAEKDRLRLIATFHPTVNEVFFARRVVLFEERTSLSAFERAAKLTGIFDRHLQLRRDVTLIDCDGKPNIPMFQKVLNHFQIPYTVIHDEDRGNPVEEPRNSKIEELLSAPNEQNKRYMISPTNIEGMLGYSAAGKDKPYQALKKVEELHASGSLPAEFLKALNCVYFGQDTEPGSVQ